MMTKELRNGRGQLIGNIYRNTLFKRVKESKHLLRVHDAWALDKVAFVKAEDAGVTCIVVHDTENNLIYSVSMDKFELNGIEVNYGHGTQIALPKKYWDVSPNKDGVG